MSLQEIIESFRTGLMLTGLWVLAAIVAGCIGVWLYRSAQSTTALLRRLRTWIDGIVFTLLFTACVLIGGTKTNSPPMGLMVPLPPSLPQSVVQTVTDEDIARGYREVAETNCEASVYAMPEGITPSFSWHKRGTFGEWARLDLGDFAFPLGTNDGAVTSFSVFNDGRIRPTPRDAAREICAVGVPMLAMQGASRFWVGEEVATERDPPGLVTTERDPPRIRLTWENFFLNADTNAPVNAQIELVANGDFVTRSNDVERIYRRVEPFDWDGDGLENTVDPDPFVAGPDAHGTNAEWYNVVCSNVLVAVEGDGGGASGTPRPTLSWLEGVNSNAYYFVDVVATNGPAPIYFTGDRESRLGNPVVVALGGETNHVPLLIGIDYAITSPVPFTVSFPDDGFATVTPNGVANYEIRWPLEFSVSPDGTGGFYIDVIPYDPGGAFQWGGGGAGSLRSGGSGASSCEYSIYGNWLGFTCLGPDCGCHGCAVDGTYEFECSTFDLPTLFCGCSPDEGDPVEPPPLTPSVDIMFSAPALIFEDRYEASPDNWVEKRSTTNVLTVSAYGGENGGTLILTSQNLGCLRRIGGGSVSLPAEIVLGPYMSYNATFRCEGAENGGTPGIWGIISGPDGTDSSYAQTTVVRVAIEAKENAPNNDRDNRHEFGIGEAMYVYQYPTSPEITVSANDATVRSGSFHFVTWGVSNIEHSLSLSLHNVEYLPLVTIQRPTGIEGYDAQTKTNGLPVGVAGGLLLVQRYKVLPLTVNFEGIKIEEVPCYDAIPPTGYFIYASTNEFPRTHSSAAGAGNLWMSIESGNCVKSSIRDRAGFEHEIYRMMPDGTTTTNTEYGWLGGGSLIWKVPFGWAEFDANSASKPIGVFAEDVRQITTISADGDFSVMKLDHTATRQINGPITLDGNEDDGILDN